MTDKSPPKAARSLIFILISLSLGALITLAGSHNGLTAGVLPIFAWCALFALAVQWLVFLPSWLTGTEHYFDLTGSLTYIAVAIMALLLTGATDLRSLLLVALICLWAARLGSFLFLRVKRDGGDGRFDQIKPWFSRFLLTWTLQALWVLLTMAAALAAITSGTPVAADIFLWSGLLLWLFGFSVEVIADMQKSLFRANPDNRNRFITSGLWAWSRHPNYFGEIVLWTGVAIIALPVLSSWQLLTLVSPLFVALLLTRVSGIPLLEARADRRWGSDPDYQAWKSNTPALIPRPPKPGVPEHH